MTRPSYKTLYLDEVRDHEATINYYEHCEATINHYEHRLQQLRRPWYQKLWEYLTAIF